MKKSTAFCLMTAALLALTVASFGAGNFVHDDGTFSYTPTASLTNGDVVAFGYRVAVPLTDIASNTAGTVATEGVFEFTLDATNAVSAGAAVYWKATGSRVTTNWAGGLKYVGAAIEAKTTTASAGLLKVELNAPVFGETGTQSTNFQSIAGSAVDISP